MLNTLANHNQDIRKLIDKGYAVGIDSDNLVIRDIPYLNSNRALQTGAFVSKLVFVNEHKVQPHDHQMFFCGEHPCEIDGSPIRNLGGGPTSVPTASDDLIVQRSFSNKPPNGFADLFEKIESYMHIICGPAMSLYDTNPFTFRTVEDNSKSVFKYRDTLTSRAEIGDLSSRFENEIVAIIGLGGTGSYLLDFLVKSPVKEIRGFDLDPFHVHNAFRSPGALDPEEFGKAKAEVYQKRYEKFRHGIHMHSSFVQADSLADLEGATFAFVCVDKGASRAGIIELLIELNIPFIDVGMGLQRINGNGPISGTLRSTYFSKESATKVAKKGIVPVTDLPDDVYQNNIQLSELNAFNAALAIIKYKQLMGFYADDVRHYHSLFTLDNSMLVGDNADD